MDQLTEIYLRYGEARNFKDRWLALYQNLYSYVIPDRDAFNQKWNYNDSGKPVTQQVWDSTAILAANQRASDLQSLLIPKDRDWGKFTMSPHMWGQQDIEAMQPQLDACNSRISYFLNNSNLSREAYGSLLDLVGGTGVLYVDSPSDEMPLRFRSVPSVCTYIEQSSEDVIGTCWFEIAMVGYKIMATFPDISGTVKTTVMNDLENTYSVLYNQIKLSEDKFYIFCTLPELDTNGIIWEHEVNYRQIIIFRDKVRPGESEGRGIGLDLLPLIIDLNHMVSDDRKNKAFKANPLLFYDTDSFINPWSLRRISGAMVPRKPGGRNPIEALQLPVYPEVMEHEQNLRDQINKGFQVEPLGEIDSSVKSATEISIRENRAQRSAATDMSRIINELPGQVYATSSKILNERNLLNKNRKGGNFDVNAFQFDFKSPLFNIQKQENLDNLAQNLQLKQQFFGEGAALASVDMGRVNEYLTQNSNLPADLFRTKDDMNKLMQGMAKANQQGQLPTPTTQASPVSLPQTTPELF